jgi:scyllo-inositol 2-dehydrogenase (NADP+)
VDVIVVATPSHVHATQVLEALRQGKHVVCEKPLALSVADADRMIDAAREAGRVLTVFHNMRYWPDVAKVRQVVESGKLGRIVQIRLTMQRFARRWDWQTLREYRSSRNVAIYEGNRGSLARKGIWRRWIG